MIRGLLFKLISIVFFVSYYSSILVAAYETDQLFRQRFKLNSLDYIEDSLRKATYEGNQLEGGYGRIFIVYDTYTEKDVLVKISSLSDNTDWLTFYMESLGLNELEHPNLLQGYGSYLVNLDPKNSKVGIAHVMEYLDRDLHQHIATHGALKTSEIKKQMGPIVSALTYLATNTLVHFDIKLENIMVKYQKGSTQSIAKLALGDFGGLRMLLPQQSSVTQRKHGMTMTAVYAPKEALFNHHPKSKTRNSSLKPGHLNEKSDVWSFALLLYVLNQQKYLLSSSSHVPSEQIQEIRKDLLTRFARDDGGCCWSNWQISRIDSDLLNMLDKMLRFNPEDRISMAEVESSGFFWQSSREQRQLPMRAQKLFKLWPNLTPERIERLLLELGKFWDNKIKLEVGSSIEI